MEGQGLLQEKQWTGESKHEPWKGTGLRLLPTPKPDAGTRDEKLDRTKSEIKKVSLVAGEVNESGEDHEAKTDDGWIY